jgi:hypothetical protein
MMDFLLKTFTGETMSEQDYEKGIRYQTIRALEDRYKEEKWFNFYTQKVCITAHQKDVRYTQGCIVHTFELSNGSKIVLEELE